MNTLSHHAPLGKPHYVYTLARPDGIVFYVGKGIGDRINDHEREAITNKTHNTHKVRTIKKIWREGGEVVKAILAYFETHEEATHYEIALIFFMEGLTNLTRGGDGIVGLPRTAEHQRKINDARRGQKATPETRRRLSIAHKNSERNNAHLKEVNERKKGKPGWNKGKPCSEEWRRHNSEVRKGKKRGPRPPEVIRKIAEANTGKKRTEEQKRRSGEARRGKPLSKPRSEEYLQKLRQATKGNHFSEEAKRKRLEAIQGKPQSAEHRRKISEANKGRKVSAEIRQKLSIAATKREAAKRAKASPDDQTSFLGEQLLYQQLHLDFEDR